MKIFTFLVFAISLLLISHTKNPYKKFQKNTSFVFVPSGTLYQGDSTVSIQAFLMLDHEITNLEYREFIHTCFLSKGDTAGAIAAMPDSTAWNTDSLTFNQPFVNLYFNHPSYNNYPVVNVSKANAEKYCIWLTDIIRQTYPESTFNNFRLPTSYEWTYAARGGLKSSPYPWGGPYTENSKGCHLANFNAIGDHNIKSDSENKPVVVGRKDYKMELENDNIYGPAITKSYQPNGFQLYNMAGNVAEMIADKDEAMGGHWNSYGNDIQVTSKISFEKANPFVGFRPIVSF